jgi:alpha-tubulin suppressor-like RCC1 family protein/formylglycine-generating enzyme required for sulfatase activity
MKKISLFVAGCIAAHFGKAGDMYVMGLNTAGQLGDGKASTISEPVLVSEDVIDVSMGERHALFVKSNGTLWGIGDNSLGQLSLEVESAPVPLGIMQDIHAVSAGGFHSFVVNSLGQLLVTGGNGAGQTGTGSGSYLDFFEQIFPGVRAVSGGGAHSLVSSYDGSLWGMGWNEHNQLGVPNVSTISRPVQIDDNVEVISAGVYHSLYIKDNGDVWGMGSNASNQLGFEGIQFAEEPVFIMSDAIRVSAARNNSFVIKKDGSLWGTGLNYSGTLGIGDEQPQKAWTWIAGNVTSVLGSYANTYFIREDRTLWGMGSGARGSLGSSGRLMQTSPVLIMQNVKKIAASPTEYSRFVLQNDGRLWAFGDNPFGILGVETGLNRTEPHLLTREVQQVAIGAGHGFLLKEDGGLWGMGNNSSGQLGATSGIDYPNPVFSAGGIQTMDAGRHHSLFLTREGFLKAVGHNNKGQLGDGSFTDRSDPVAVDSDVVAISAGRMHSLYLKRDGRLYGMGQNEHGELGQGDKTNRNQPVLIAEGVTSMAAGGRHSLFITKDGKLYGCGSNENGELGLGELAETLEPMLIADYVRAVSAGFYHTVFVRSDYSLWGMGRNTSFQLGLEADDDVLIPEKLASSVSKIAAGWYHTLVLDRSNTLFGAGSNAYGELASIAEDSPGWHDLATSVSAFDAVWFTSYYVVSDFWNGWPVRSTGDLYAENGFSWMNVEKDPWVWIYSLSNYAYVVSLKNAGAWMYFPSNRNAKESWDALVPDNDGDVNWDDGLGWVNIIKQPWVYVYALSQYVYLEESLVGSNGSWAYSFQGVRNRDFDENGRLEHHEFIKMVKIPAGSFLMGDAFSEGDGDELPVHTVELSAYRIGETEVTLGQWQEVRDWAVNNGYPDLSGVGFGKGVDHPVYDVNWYDVVKWSNAASEKAGLEPVYLLSDGGAVYRTGEVAPFIDYSKSGYRLPTEAEWEKAARGGLEGARFPWGDTISHAKANYDAYPSRYSYDVNGTEGFHPDYDEGGQPYTSPAGSFVANGYGLYDVAGNVLEWCGDWYESGYFGSSAASDPAGPESGSDRVVRGGVWAGITYNCRVADRVSIGPSDRDYYFGFRLARSEGPQ